MKILHTVEFYYPSLGGAQEVVKQLSEKLVNMGHDVTVATTRISERNFNSLNGVKIKEFDIRGNYVQGIKGEINNYREFVINGDFDIIMNYAAQQWATDSLLPILSEIKSKKVFVPCGFSQLYNPEYSDYFNNMKKWMLQYNKIIFLSDIYRDIDFAKANGITNIKIIPNGAGEEEFLNDYGVNFRVKHNLDKKFIILTLGSFTGFKGHFLVAQAYKKANIKNSVLLLMGDVKNKRDYYKCKYYSHFISLVSLGKKKVIMLDGSPRERVIGALQAADLFVFGSNIECSPIVLFEATAAKTPFISVNCGNAEEIAEWTGGGIVIRGNQTSSGFIYGEAKIIAKNIEDLFYNNEKRKRLAELGFQTWKDKFTWNKITQEYENMYLNIAGISEKVT